MISDNTQAEPLDKTTVMQSVILPNELRIGSIISDIFSETTQPFTITKLLQNKCYYKPGSNAVYDCKYENLKPIPLTEEWLLKFGFSTTDYKKGYIGIDHKAGGIITDFVLTYPLVIGEFQKHFIWEHSKFKYNDLKYVHQLQNLFFVLTGFELTVA
jgi:hypothetical protein